MKGRGLLQLPAPPPDLPGAGYLFGLVLCGWLVCMVGVGAFYGDGVPEGYRAQTLLHAASLVVACLVPLVMAFQAGPGRRALGLAVDRGTPVALAGGAGLWLLGALVLTPVVGLYFQVLAWAGVANDPQPLYRHLATALTEGPTPWVLILGVSLAVPLGEELVFRGFLHAFLRPHLGRWGTILLAGALFGALHFEPWTMMIPLTFIGVLFGYIRERTGSFWGAWVAHALQNGVSILFSPHLIQLYDKG